MRSIARTTTRLGAYAASAALVISGTALAVPPAQGVTYDPAPANQAANWLSGQLTIEHLAPSGYDAGVDVGLSFDYIFALLAVGGHATTVKDIADAIQGSDPSQGETGYVQYTYSDGTHNYAGRAANATAKAMSAFQTISPTRATIGSINLRSRLESLVATTPRYAGRIVDVSTKDGVPDGQDYANTLGQSYAAHALHAVGSAKAGAVRDFLLSQQCPGGFFRLSFSPKTSTNQGCAAGDSPDTDATAIAVTQLASQGSTPAVASAIARAKTWLVRVQRCDGSFGGGTTTEASNANSTGLAAWALGGSQSARQAARALKALQIPQNAGPPQQNARGAIALNSAALAQSRTDGLSNSATADQFRRATAQAAPGIRWFSADATPALDLVGPAGYLKAGSRAVLTTTGATQGTVLCLTGPGASTHVVAGTAAWRPAVTLPAGTGTRVYAVKDPFGHRDTRSLHVLGRKALPVATSRFRVKRRHLVNATVSGLAPGEWSRIYYKGAFIRSGHATSAGKFAATFRVGRSKGRKLVQGFGQFTDIRRGATTIKVVR